MLRNIKNIITFLLLITLMSLLACANNTKEISNIEKIDWKTYDNLINDITACTDREKRVLLMHQAEDFLMDTGLIIPLFNSNSQYIANDELKDYYICLSSSTHFEYAYYKGRDTINIQCFTEPSTLVVNIPSAEYAFHLSNLISSNLTKADKNGNIIPHAAESIDISDDELTYTFHLRDDLKWSDGSVLNANDFIYTFNWCTNPKNTCEYIDLYRYIDGYPSNLNIKTADNDSTLIIKLKYPCPFFLELLSMPVFSPINKSDVEKYSSDDPKAWGMTADHLYSGAYVVKTWKHRESMILEKNPYYFDKDKIKSNNINFMLTNDASITYNAFLKGDIDFINSIPSSLVDKLKNDKKYHTTPRLSMSGIVFNSKCKIFENMTAEQAKTFRKAINYAIDRDFILNLPLHGNGITVNQVVPTHTSDGNGNIFKKNSNLYTYPHKDLGYFDTKRNLDKARELLSSIGYKFNSKGILKTPISFEYMFNPTPENNSIAECLQQDLSEIGINLIPVSVEFTQMLAQRDSGNFQSARFSWTLDYNDPISMLDQFLSTNPNNCFQLK